MSCLGNRLGFTRALLIAALSLGCTLVFAPSPAIAGTWAIVSCSLPGQPTVAEPVAGWSSGVLPAGIGPYSGDVDACGTAGSGLLAQVSGQASQPAYGGPMWTFTAPAGSTIAGGTLDVTMTAPEGQVAFESPNQIYDSADVLANCQLNLPCGGILGGTQVWNGAPITHTGGSHLYEIAECVAQVQGQTSCGPTNGMDAVATLRQATIELQNDAMPAASAFAGTALSPNARGLADLTFSATDAGGPGIYQVAATLDGHTAYAATPARNGGRCVSIGSDPSGAFEFQDLQPCPASESVDAPLDTTVVADGSHLLKLLLIDAAQNTGLVLSQQVTTQNAPLTSEVPLLSGTPQVGALLSGSDATFSTPAGAGGALGATLMRQWLRCDSAAANCSPIGGAGAGSHTLGDADAGHTLRYENVASDADGSTTVLSAPSGVVAATTTAGGSPGGQGTPNGNPPSDVADLAVHWAGAAQRRSVGFTASARAVGRLTTAVGQPIAGARIDIVAQPSNPGAASVQEGSAVTATDGSFSFMAHQREPSRTLSFSYRSRALDPSPAASAQLELLVVPRLMLNVNPRRVHRGTTIHIVGSVPGPVPATGTQVLLQARQLVRGGRWVTFDAQATDGAGRFATTYTFRVAAVTRYALRAYVRAEQDWPYLPAASPEVMVSER